MVLVVIVIVIAAATAVIVIVTACSARRAELRSDAPGPWRGGHNRERPPFSIPIEDDLRPVDRDKPPPLDDRIRLDANDLAHRIADKRRGNIPCYRGANDFEAA